ncbi:ecotropic viral integration site 5 protein [Dorcoceras hygrometricum]|uniref:Ecotropic viral integration site 5 protein n=1 Tax=Dorcoceras hygrometricum TaxID=472368 RepID=A0A2Z7BYP2_9LAMI|nr:ecotropic viral integration site 5 protein [Dorcoceras hygrometricum]
MFLFNLSQSSLEADCRDAYGFAVRPQHLQRYREYANIYKEEEEERSDRWKDFLERQAESVQSGGNLSDKDNDIKSNVESTKVMNDDSDGKKPNSESFIEENEKTPSTTETKVHCIQIWTEIRPSLRAIEDMMSSRVTAKINLVKNELACSNGKQLPAIEEARPVKGASEDDSDEEFYDLERSESDPVQDIPSYDSTYSPAAGSTGNETYSESLPPWKEELDCLVQGGVPMALRGELWQAFVGVRKRRIEKYYSNLLAPDANVEIKHSVPEDKNHGPNLQCGGVPEKWKGQIEKDLPRTFPGHPALDEDGRNALRRLLTAYARHNPSVGYCQAMNFFAGLLLLLMPEENAFWTLVGILDDYFDGYYSEEMIEAQVDQLVLEELIREKFPKLGGMGGWAVVSLNIYEHASMGKCSSGLGCASISRKSCDALSDRTFFNGAIWIKLTLVQFCAGPALVTTKDAGDAVTLLQSLAGSTFDSSQLVLTACMGYHNVNETRLQDLRNKHRPAVKAILEERSKGVRIWKDSQGLASKLYSFKQDPGSVMAGAGKPGQTDVQTNGGESHLDASSDNVNRFYMSLNGNEEIDSVKDIQDQVVWLKVELCKLLEEKQSAELRAEELETALMEMVKQDNRRQLSARVEQLESELSELRQAYDGKQEQENAMLQILMRVEQEQKVTEDARRFAEQDAAAQRYASQVLQEKYEEAIGALAEMEKRTVMAESMLEATLQYQSGQTKAQPSPRSTQQDSSVIRSNQDPSPEIQARKISLLSRPFGLGWRDRNKVKSISAEEPNDGRTSNEGQSSSTEHEKTNDHPVEEK